PQAIQDVSRELSGLCSILRQLEGTLKVQPDSSPPYPAELMNDLQNVLASCKTVLNRLQTLMNKFSAYENEGSWIAIMRNLRFMFMEKDIARIQRSLQTHKDTLSITLLLAVKYVLDTHSI